MTENSIARPSTKRAAMLPVLGAVVLGVALAAAQGTARADIVTDWNLIAINATAGASAAAQSRMLAIAHIAMYDAARAFDSHRSAYAVDVKAPAGASIEAAVAAAAHGTLKRLMPSQLTMLDDALSSALGKIADANARAGGLTVGQQVAEQIIAIRSKDKSNVNAKAAMQSGIGKYQVTPPHDLPVVLAGWAEVTPFAIKSANGYVLKGPPAVNSAEFARDFNEVKSIGARDSKTRTADQTAAAIFWIIQTSVPFNAAARAAAERRNDGIINTARLFALLNAAGSDSQVACYAEKNRWHHWRPITAIRAAASLNNPALQGDPSWEPLIGTPPHQEYPSAHACLAGAAETVLKAYFSGDAIGATVNVTSPPVLGVTRTYTRFSQIADENEEARIWGGIHYRSADVDGRLLGRMVAEEVLNNFRSGPATTER